MKHPVVLAMLWAALGGAAWVGPPARAYTLRTVASESCHERLTGEALNELLALLGSPPPLPVPEDDVLQRLLTTVQFPGTEDYDDSTRFLLLSLIVGVRSPDTEGHSTLNLSALRRLHGDPSPRGQYAHALRGPADDGLEGDVAAVAGTHAAIREELDLAQQAVVDRVVADRPFYVDHYGSVDVPVALFAWHLGRAIHALQDAHAHMVWNEDVSHIVHVLNYVEAVEGTLQERDGEAHSDALDDCNRSETEPIVAQARTRTIAFIEAAAIALAAGDRATLEVGLAPCDGATLPDHCGWLVYNPACAEALDAENAAAIEATCCTSANDFCSSPYADIAREEPAGPYLGCGVGTGRSRAPWLLASVLVALRWRSRKRAAGT